jgi:hypothetical protein
MRAVQCRNVRTGVEIGHCNYNERFFSMLSLDTSDRAFICVRAQGILRWRDYSNFERQISDELNRRRTPIPLLLDLRGFRGWSPAGLVRDLIFDLRHRASFSRIAVLGDARWHAWITYLAIPLFRARLRFFNGRNIASEWLRTQVRF